MRTKEIRAFSLVEVCIALVIVAVLVGIVAAVSQRGKDAAKDTLALNNARQVGLAHILYAGDFDDYLPHWRPSQVSVFPTVGTVEEVANQVRFNTPDAKKWKELLLPYVKAEELFYLPTDPLARIDARYLGTIGPKSSQHTSFLLNGIVGTATLNADGSVNCTLFNSAEVQARLKIPFLAANIIQHPQRGGGSVSVHKWGVRVPAWFADGSAKIIGIEEVGVPIEKIP